MTTLSPTDRAFIAHRVDDDSLEGAAHEFAVTYGLPDDARDLLSTLLRKAYDAGYWCGQGAAEEGY